MLAQYHYDFKIWLGQEGWLDDWKVERWIAQFSRDPLRASWKNVWDLLDESEEVQLSDVTSVAIIWCDKKSYCRWGRSWHLSLQVFAQLFMLWSWWWFLIDGAQSRGVLSRKQKERGQNKISAGGFRSQLLREDITRKKRFLSGFACKGDQLLTNCWPLGDHLVTTWWPLLDHCRPLVDH